MGLWERHRRALVFCNVVLFVTTVALYWQMSGIDILSADGGAGGSGFINESWEDGSLAGWNQTDPDIFQVSATAGAYAGSHALAADVPAQVYPDVYRELGSGVRYHEISVAMAAEATRYNNIDFNLIDDGELVIQARVGYPQRGGVMIRTGQWEARSDCGDPEPLSYYHFDLDGIAYGQNGSIEEITVTHEDGTVVCSFTDVPLSAPSIDRVSLSGDGSPGEVRIDSLVMRSVAADDSGWLQGLLS